MSESRVPIQENGAVTGVESPPERGSRWQVAGRALRHRNFQLFFSGQLISLIGTWMQSVAQSWLVYRLTGSALLLGSVGFASQVPVFVFAPLGGIAADRFNRRQIVIATQTAAMLLAAILAALTLFHKVQVWHVFVLASLLGIVNAFDIPGRQSFLVDMVGKEDLMNAIALNSSMFNGARVIGPAIAVILCQRGELHRRDYRIASDEGDQPGPRGHGIAAGAHDGGVPFREPDSADSRAAAAAGIGEPGGYALRGADADLRRSDLARGCARIGNSDGRDWSRSAAGRADPGFPRGRKRFGTLGGMVLRRVWSESCYFCSVAHVLGFGDSVAAGGLLHDAADGVLKHADPGDGSGRSAGACDGRVFDDVHGHGSDWSAFWRRAGRAFRCAPHGSDRRVGIGVGRMLVRAAFAEDQSGSAAVDCCSGRGRRRTLGDDGTSSGRLGL